MPRITIHRAGSGTAGGDPAVVVDVPDGTTLFDAGAQVQAQISTACVGKGTCGLCRVKIVAGNEHLPAFTDEERKHLGNVFHITKVRLACRCRVSGGDVTIEVVRPRAK